MEANSSSETNIEPEIDENFSQLFEFQQIRAILDKFQNQGLYESTIFICIENDYRFLYQSIINHDNNKQKEKCGSLIPNLIKQKEKCGSLIPNLIKQKEKCGSLIRNLIKHNRFSEILETFHNILTIHVAKLTTFYSNIIQTDIIESILQNLGTAIQYLKSHDYSYDIVVLTNLHRRIDQFLSILREKITMEVKTKKSDNNPTNTKPLLDRFSTKFFCEVSSDLNALRETLKLSDDLKTVHSILQSAFLPDPNDYNEFVNNQFNAFL